MKLHLHKDKYSIEQSMDAINDNAIQCQESLSINEFKRHANNMMRNAFKLDSILHISKRTSTYNSVKQLINCIKELQHPIISKNDVSDDTRDKIKYVYQNLSKLSSKLDL